MRAVRVRWVAGWAAGLVGVTAALGPGLLFVGRQGLPTPSWWRHWEEPQALYPQGTLKGTHINIPKDSLATQATSSQPRPTPEVYPGGDSDPTPIAPLPVRAPTPTVSAIPTPSPTARKPPPNVFYFEDFSEVADGVLPEGWTGGEHLAVMTLPRGKRVITPFESSEEHKVLTAPIDSWPKDWRLEWVLQPAGERYGGAHYTVIIGNLTTDLKTESVTSSDVYFTFRMERSEKRIQSGTHLFVRIAIEKRGSVFKAYMNGIEVLLIRMDNWSPPLNLNLTMTDAGNFYLEEIVGTAIEEKKDSSEGEESVRRP